MQKKRHSVPAYFLIIFFVFSSSLFAQSEKEDPLKEILLGEADKDSYVYDSLYVDEVDIVYGESAFFKVYNLQQISIADPKYLDPGEVDSNKIEVRAIEPGQTTLFIIDDYGKRPIAVHIANKNLESIKRRVQRLLRTANIHEVHLRISEEEGKVIAYGGVPERKLDQADKILIDFEDDVINLIREEDLEDLIQLDIQVTELNETLTKSLGIDWFAAGSGGVEIDSSSGQGNFNPIYTEDTPDFDGSIRDFFKIGDFRRSSAFAARLNALVEEGKARVLSRPKLVVKNGEEASFLVGGEIPIRSVSVSNNSTTENIAFKDFGVSMTMTPEIKNNKINIEMTLEVSDVDAANAVGENVAFSTRTAQTELLLDDRQTIIMAGFIKKNESERVKKVPFLNKVPIVGLLFRSKQTPTPILDQELVISLTPTVLAKNREIFQSDSDSDAESFSSDMHAAKPEKVTRPMRTMPMAGIPSEMAEYVQKLQEQISSAVVYPREAREYGWEGTVKIGLLILHDGTLAYALVKESSGNDLFDEYALNTVKNVAPYANFPANTDLQELNITVPIIYSLKQQ